MADLRERTDIPDIVVTLVHGTFAPWAGWTRKGSKLRRELSSQLVGRKLEFVRFKWTSWNAPWARRRAARQLSERLRENLKQWPRARHCVIGHSHGGGVALGAFDADPTLINGVGGVATLATPFIAFRRRGLMGAHAEPTSIRLWGASLAAIIGLGIGWVFVFLFLRLTETHPVLTSFVLMAAFLAAAVVVARVTPRVSKFADGFASRLQASCVCQVPTCLNVLIVRTVGDEASAILAASRFVAWLSGRLWFVLSLLLSPLALLHRGLGRAAWWVPATLVLLSAVLLPPLVALNIIMDAIGGAPSTTPLYVSVFDTLRQNIGSGFTDPTILNVLAMALATAVIVGALLGVGILALWPIFLAVGFILSPVFGAEAALTAMAWEISEEPVPDGSWTVHQYSSESDGSLLDLAHGLTYDDKRVHERLARWIATIRTADQLASPHDMAAK